MIGEIASRQILVLSDEGLSSMQIATELGIQEELVKLTLNAYKKGSEVDRDINDSQLQLLRQKALSLALAADDESVSARMCMYLIDRDKPKDSGSAGPSIGAINMVILGAQEKLKELTAKYTSTIEIVESK